jgi:patatin-like phospholipase/acyl hydrolase
MSHAIKVLAIDGGGIRGILPAIILSEIERRAGQGIAHLFDLIAGTSTGGLLALGLTVPDSQGQPKFSAAELAIFYELEGPTIFSRGMWHRFKAVGNISNSKYPSGGIDSVLQHFLGETMLSQAIGNVLITGYEIQRHQSWFFRSRNARQAPSCDFRMKDVVRASTAAPTYFEPAQLSSANDDEELFALIDGGLQSNNPALCAYVEAKSKNPDADNFLLVSLGTGAYTPSIHFDEAKQWGLVSWSQHLIDVIFHGMSDTVDYQLRHLLPTSQEGIQRYYRFETELSGVSNALDDISAQNIEGLKNLAHQMIENNDVLIDQLVEQLLI